MDSTPATGCGIHPVTVNPFCAICRAHAQDSTPAPEPVTTVLFRRWRAEKDGSGVIALFPFEPGWRHPLVMSYEHTGQHGNADFNGVMRRTRPATPAEYAALKTELESPPFWYVLDVRQRTPHTDPHPR